MKTFAEATTDVFWPLRVFYVWKEIQAPEFIPVTVASIESPYRSLLVHDRDMTPTLQEYHKDSIHLSVLNFDIEDDILTRFVILKTDGDERPIEFGAIQIDVGLMDTVPRNLVMEGHIPFGGILYMYDIPHTSRPSCFFEVESDEVMEEAFQMDRSRKLYGRCNTISFPSGDPLAYVVEILPPEYSRK